MNAHIENKAIENAVVADAVARDTALGDVLLTIAQSKWLIAGIVLLSMLGGLSHMVIAQPIYRADTLLYTGRHAAGIGALGDFADLSALFYSLKTNAEARILRSRAVIGPVVDDLNLDIVARPARVPVVGAAIARISIDISDNGTADPWANLANPWFDLGRYGWGSEYIKVRRFDAPNALLGEKLTVVARGGGRYRLFLGGQRLMQGRVGKVEQARLAGNERISILVSALAANRRGTQFEIEKEARLNAIADVNESLTIEAQVADEEASAKSSPTGLLELSFENPNPRRAGAVLQGIVQSYLALNVKRKFKNANMTLGLLTQQLDAVRAQMRKTEQELSNYRFEKGSVNLKMETEVLLQKVVAAETRLSELRRRRTRLLQKFTAEHKRVMALDTHIAVLYEDIRILENRIKALPRTQQEILRFSREAKVDRRLYTLLSNKVQELKVVKAGTVGSASILDSVAVPVKPITPRMELVMTMYTILGGVLGVSAAFIRKSLRGVVEDPDEIERQLGIPVYAVVPHSPKQKKCAKGNGRKGTKRAILSVRNPQDIAVESLRSLRTWMNFALINAGNNVLVVSGPTPGVGKSFVSMNLGALWAGAGKRVVLVDADLRKGRLHQHFGVEPERGVSEVIADGLSKDDAIRDTSIKNLFIMTRGAAPPNPSELLMHGGFAALLEDLSLCFDHVIVDSPPVLAVTDAAILGRLAAAALLVVRANTHTLREIENSIQRLRQSGVPLRGVVFNDLDTSKRYGYGKHYGYAYGYS